MKLASLILLLPLVSALNVRNASVCGVAKVIAKGAVSYYSYEYPGEFQGALWWISGVTVGSLLNYQDLCNDNQFEDIIYESLIEQSGSSYNYQPSQVENVIGNDDIGAWGLTVVAAAESNFKAPQDGSPSWLNRAENVFDLLYGRWDGDTCSGGIRWQFNKDHAGALYKATIANANLFQLAARLAKLTNDNKYVEAAEKIYSWLTKSGLVNELQWGTEVYDGFNVDNCENIEKVLWTYNYGVVLAGTAQLFDITGNTDWSDRTEHIILGSQSLYKDEVLYERACVLANSCNDDQRIFKGIYARSLGQAKELVPSLRGKVIELFTPSSQAAARSCSGGSDGTTCGQDWSYDNNGVYWDGKNSLQEQISALEAVLVLKA